MIKTSPPPPPHPDFQVPEMNLNGVQVSACMIFLHMPELFSAGDAGDKNQVQVGVHWTLPSQVPSIC